MADTALLVMDVQLGVVTRFNPPAEYLGLLREAIAAARRTGVLVVYVRVAFRPGLPEVSPQNKSFRALLQSGHAPSTDTSASTIHPEIRPESEDIVVTKLRVSAFAGSDLEVVLRSQGVRNLVLSGIATSGVVLSTLRAAADLDYQLTVLSDACLDADPEVHRVLTEKVFPRQADVRTVSQWISGLEGRDSR